MAESNFATKLQVLKDLKEACTLMGGYNPLQNLIKVAAMGGRIADIEGANLEINPLESILKDNRDERVLKVFGQIEDDAFNGLIRRVRQIATYVDGLGDKYESEAVQIRRLVKKMDPDHTRRKPTGPDDKTRSTSEQSFDSITANAGKILEIIKLMKTGGISDYTPADATITQANYTALIAEILALTKKIAETDGKLKPFLKKRDTLTNRKSDGVRKIVSETKKYVRGNYGSNSSEYNSIRLIKV